MTRRIVGAFLGLGFTSGAIAQPLGGSSTFQLNWSATAATPVPTMSTYAIALLAILLTVAAYRLTRNQGTVIRAVAPLVTFGVAATILFKTASPIAGVLTMIPPIDATESNGSQTYTAIAPTDPPPCYINNCGMPVTVTYNFISAETGDGTPITDETCTRLYFCDEAGEGPFVADGQVVESDGQPFATAYCQEIFDGGEGGPA